MFGDSTVKILSRFLGVFGLPVSVLLLASWGTWTGGVFCRSFSRSVSTSEDDSRGAQGDTVAYLKNGKQRESAEWPLTSESAHLRSFQEAQFCALLPQTWVTLQK